MKCTRRYFVHNFLLLFILTCEFMTVRVHAGNKTMVLTLPDKWNIQPAKCSSIPPKPDAWGKPPGNSNSLWYEQYLKLPEDADGMRIVLNFLRIEGDAIVFCNGERAGELLRPAGEIDISKQAIPGYRNVIRVFLTRDYTDISRDYKQDPLRYTARKKIPVEKWHLGITGPVQVILRPRPVAIRDVFIIPSWRKKTLTLEVELQSDKTSGEYRIEGVVLDADGKKVLSLHGEPLHLKAGLKTFCITSPWKNPIPWELDRGYLYKLVLKVTSEGKIVNEFPAVSFGFREVWTQGKKLYMNGHPSRWRYAMNLTGITVNTLPFYQLLGANVINFQANPGAWWSSWKNEYPLIDETVLREMDEKGIGATTLAPTIFYLRSQLLSDSQARKDYEREMSIWIRRYRNHPSILAWIVGMNVYCPDSAMLPETLGKREQASTPLPKAISLACKIAKTIDPTRLVFSHADGGIGDVANANVYLNFSPVQEQEEWPMEWAKNGNMPFGAMEFGHPFEGDFWKKHRCLVTEYLAMYLGEEAYTSESEEALRKMIEYSLANKRGFGVWDAIKSGYFPGYWDFQHIFVQNVDRAWRTWGVNCGWIPWVLVPGYGDPPGYERKRHGVIGRYLLLRKPVSQKPEWANPNFDMYRKNNLPLLVYLAGYPQHTDKTHGYYSGERIIKQIAAIWDGPGKHSLSVRWELYGPGKDNVLESGKINLNLKAGDISLTPFSFTAPDVKQRSEYFLKLTVNNGKKIVATDKFAMEIFPQMKSLELDRRIAVYDPEGSTTKWLKTLGISSKPFDPEKPKSCDLLIIGRQALKQGSKFPVSSRDIQSGLRVLIMEQQPDVWRGMGYQTLETMPRYVFARNRQSSILKGLHKTDLINWRGSPNLLPEGKNARGYDVEHVKKWTNTHAIASVVLQIPQVVGVTPVLQCEFDLDYSPLLEWRIGQGVLYCCSLDLSGRIGKDPAATLLAANLLRTAAGGKLPPLRTVCYSGGIADKKFLESLCVDLKNFSSKNNPLHTVLVLGRQSSLIDAELNSFIRKGGIAFYLPRDKTELEKDGFKVDNRSYYRITRPENRLFRGVGPGLLRWRDCLECTAFTAVGQPDTAKVLGDGLFLFQSEGEGKRIYSQLAFDQLTGRYPKKSDKWEAINLSIIRINQLYSQLLTNLGIPAAQSIGERILQVDFGATYETLGHWHFLGPFPAPQGNAKNSLDTVFSGEQDAIDGNINPNTIYTRRDGAKLDWRKTVLADETGFVNLSGYLNSKIREKAVAYVTRVVHRDRDQIARLRLGADYSLKAWVNGKLVYMTLGRGAPLPNRYQVDVPLRAGDNVITLKVSSGSRGFGFWANISNCGITNISRDKQTKKSSLYDKSLQTFDPYEYYHW